jgi:hypothetical protein
MSNKSKIKKTSTPAPELKLDLGAGQNPIPGFKSVDLYAPNVDIKLDLFKFPWPWANDSVTELHASHFIEHVPQKLRWPFFEECWRVLKPEGSMKIVVPSWKSERSLGDMTHEFPPVTAFFFFYLNKGWREANKLTYGPYALKCNFDHQAGPTSVRPEFASRNHEVQVFALTHYFEAYDDMWVTLTKKPL